MPFAERKTVEGGDGKMKRTIFAMLMIFALLETTYRLESIDE